MPTTVLVTGATGKTGRRLVPLLSRRGFAVHAATRSPGTPVPEATATVPFDWRDRTTFAPALGGVDAIYMVTSHNADHTRDPSDQVEGFVAAAVRVGVQRIVHLSAFGIDKAPESEPLRRTERIVEDSGIAFTTLRPAAFMENFSEPHWARFAEQIRQHDEFCMPNGRARMSFVSVQDIAGAAMFALTDDARAGKAYTLTGPEPLSWGDVAAHISAAVGRPISYRETDADWIRRLLLKDGATEEYAVGEAQLVATSIGEDFMAEVSADVQTLTGRPPTSFADFARASVGAWR